jgi:hypothetical protein
MKCSTEATIKTVSFASEVSLGMLAIAEVVARTMPRSAW